ncbi:hypothetical protein A6A06_00390 [Streptomyces sp. CB02923]|nr:hypothetical protein A6A06_00390 [Streptomyces sp. CB02923]
MVHDYGTAVLGVLSRSWELASEGLAVSKLEEGVVHVVACFPANAQSAWSVEVGDGCFGDPSHPTQSRAVRLSSMSDLGNDVPLSQAAVDVVVIVGVGTRPSPVDRARADFWAASPPLGLHVRGIDGGAGEVQPVRRP